MSTKLINGYPFQLFEPYQLTPEEMIIESNLQFELLNKRRTIRDFSNKEVPISVIENAIKIASTAPSGAHKQPWTFCVIEDQRIKQKIRAAAEEEEQLNYSGRMSEAWLKDLAPLGTNDHKPFLETAPYLIAVFKQVYEAEGNEKLKNYYVNESVGIACGFLLYALHTFGLCALTHTPSPMNFLSKILERPENERAYLLIPVGLPADEVYVPELARKPLDKVMVHY